MRIYAARCFNLSRENCFCPQGQRKHEVFLNYKGLILCDKKIKNEAITNSLFSVFLIICMPWSRTCSVIIAHSPNKLYRPGKKKSPSRRKYILINEIFQSSRMKVPAWNNESKKNGTKKKRSRNKFHYRSTRRCGENARKMARKKPFNFLFHATTKEMKNDVSRRNFESERERER